MTTKVDYTPLMGGLNLVSGALNVQPGCLLECRNFEQVFGLQGYRRIEGYERFDGRPEPHKAVYYLADFTDGVLQINPGDVVFGASGSAEVIAVDLQSGAWTGTAAGRLVLTLPVGAFVVGENIKVGATVAAKITSLPALGGIGEPRNNEFIALARETLRADIGPVPGSGPILGVAAYDNDVYAARNAADGKTAALYRSGPAGWELIRGGFLPDGKWRFNPVNLTGMASNISLFGVDGRNRLWKWDGAAMTFAAPIYGSQATSTTSLDLGTGAKTWASIDQSDRSWKVGDVLLVHSAADAGKRMIGTVTAYSPTAPGTLTLNVTESLGSGTVNDWVISAADFVDKPFLITDHKDHMFLGFPKGQLQTSNLGDPMLYTTTAASFGMGDEITGVLTMRGAVLGVFCKNRITVISGSSALDWQLEPYSQSAGAKLETALELSGNAVFLDERGLTSLQSTQNFGDFEPSIFSREIKPLMDEYSRRIVASRIARTKFQYRLYADDGLRLTATFLSPEAVIQPKDVVFTTQRYPHAPVCVAHGDMLDGSEGMFFGTADGYVMREDVGVSFDGQEIYALARLHFNHLKSPAAVKRYRKLDVEMDSPNRVTLYFRQRFDYADGEYSTGPSVPVESAGTGGAWDASQWDRFYWSLPSTTRAEANIDGVGRNMGLLIYHVSNFDEPFTLQGLLLQYSQLGMRR